MSFFDKDKDDLKHFVPTDLPPEHKQDYDMIRSFVDEVRQSGTRTSHESTWMTNIAYLLGFDGIYYDGQSKSFRPVNNASGFLRRNRIHANFILSTIQTRTAKLNKAAPMFDVRPNSNNPEDKDAARLGIKIIEDEFLKNDIDTQRIHLYNWLQQCGHAYVEVRYDDTIGKPMNDPETGEFLGFEGGVVLEIVPALEGFPDPLAKNMREVTKFVRARVRKLDYFRTAYPELGKYVKEEGAWLTSIQYENRINGMNNVMSGSGVQQMKDAAIELTYYEKPCRKYPNGRMIVAANGVVLENKELPIGEIPYAKFDDIVVGGKFYCEAMITHLRPLQDQYNRTLAREADWINKLFKGGYLASRGSNLAAESLDDKNGEVIYFNQGPNSGPPVPLQPPMVPTYIYQSKDGLKRDFDEIGGISEISKGQIPAAGIPAKGMEILIEADDSRIGVELAQHEQAWAKVGGFVLKFVQKYYKTDRLLKTAGDSLGFTVKNFVGADLRDNTDVIVIKGSTLPGSKALKRQEILNLASQGLLGNIADPLVQQRLLKNLEFGDLADIFKSIALTQNKYKKDLDMLEMGQMPEIFREEDHQYIIKEISDYKKTDKYGMANPIVKQAIAQYLDAHLQWAMAVAGAAPDPEVKPLADEMNQLAGELGQTDQLDMMNQQQELLQNQEVTNG